MKRTRPMRLRSHRFGMVAEIACITLLLIKGYNVLSWRQRNYMGEIDIVARKRDMLVFVEVKARRSRQGALESVTRDKQQRLMQAALTYHAANAKFAQHTLRFDVMVVTSRGRIYHLKDAWRA